MTPHTDYRLVLSTCPDTETARSIGERLVAERLAACVSLIPGLTSIYRWEGKVHQDPEVLLLIKTSAARLDALMDVLQQLHPYEVPEIIALPVVAGLPDYLSWIASCTHPQAHD
jgi:periplasmic divalent cation tolerance protein